jgi:hypothetical protein
MNVIICTSNEETTDRLNQCIERQSKHRVLGTAQTIDEVEELIYLTIANRKKVDVILVGACGGNKDYGTIVRNVLLEHFTTPPKIVALDACGTYGDVVFDPTEPGADIVQFLNQLPL